MLSEVVDGPPVRILVVDDETDVAESLAQLLVREGYYVRTAKDGEDALSQFISTPFDVVITDMRMPKMDGLELTKELKKIYRYTDVIVITGFQDSYRYSQVVEAGAADFLSKPFKIQELLAKLRRVLRDRRDRIALVELVLRDALTGAYNRHAFDSILLREVTRAIRLRYPVAILFMDFDDFKKFNDAYGHLAGDQLLKNFVGIVLANIRKDLDYLFRYGGDEFVLFVVNVDIDGVEKLAKRIIYAFCELSGGKVEISIGIAYIDREVLDQSDDLELESLLKTADEALYEAKKKKGSSIITRIVSLAT